MEIFQVMTTPNKSCLFSVVYRVSLLGSPGLADDVPVHMLHLQDFLPELQALTAHFHLSYDVWELRSTADEMELYSMVMSPDRQDIQLILKREREKINKSRVKY